jgi:hypothetical protein
MKKIFLFLLSVALFTSCERKIDEFSVSSGSADFSRFIAVGNSLVAGYADGQLYHNGQVYSIPNILSQQLQYAGSGKFVQPMMTSEYGLGYPGATTKFELGYSTDCANNPIFGPVHASGTMDPIAPVGYLVNNLGIPGAKSFHMLYPGYALFNPFYARFATSATNKVIDEIAPLNPTFFMEWLGDNDVLSYALTGGVGDTITGPTVFQGSMYLVLQALTANGAKGVIATVPNITDIPYFTTIPYNGLVLSRQSLVDSVNYAMQTVYGLPFTYQLGQNPFLVADPTSANPYFKVRQMVPGELVLLSVPQDSMKCHGMGIISVDTHVPYPIPSQYVLTSDEILAIVTATETYNAIIKGLASQLNLAVADMNENFKNFKSGIVWDGITFNTTFVSGGLFSLDGIHPNPRGAALAANYFIDAINAKYGSTIPHADVTKYPGIIYP